MLKITNTTKSTRIQVSDSQKELFMSTTNS